jgi:FabA-like domain
MLQLLRVALVERDLHRGLERPRFEPILPDRPFSWKYRGQVLPTHRIVTVEVEVLEARRDQEGALVVGDAWLSVDGSRIYEARGLGVRVRPGP